MSRVNVLLELLGDDTVLLPIPRGKKGPRRGGWQKFTREKMKDAAYRSALEDGNIGVLQGRASGGLCSIDIDADDDVEPFLTMNPKLRDSLRSRGQRGCNIWIKIDGDFPALAKLFHEMKVDKDGKPLAFGEWRADGGQTVIDGLHPSGCDHSIIHHAPPLSIAFSEINWPESLRLPWRPSPYEKLVSQFGEPFSGRKLNERFFAGKFAMERLVIHEADEREFYVYDGYTGLWVKTTFDRIKSTLAKDVSAYADTQNSNDLKLQIGNAFTTNVVQLLRGEAERRNVFQQKGDFIHLANGVLRLDQTPMVLTEFSHSFYSRNRSPIDFVHGANCPRFLNQLLAQALDQDDIELLQQYCGSLLLGGNAAQKIMMLMGNAGTGKSTVTEIIERVRGKQNVTEFRTHLLHERFELSRFIGKTLLAGKDVPADFMMQKGASALKKLVGGDLFSAEKKNNNAVFELHGNYDVMITCNSRLRIKFEGDADAWRRRLVIIEYNRPKPKDEAVVANFADVLLNEEGPGILNWMIHGAMAFVENGKKLRLTAKQQARAAQLHHHGDPFGRLSLPLRASRMAPGANTRCHAGITAIDGRGSCCGAQK